MTDLIRLLIEQVNRIRDDRDQEGSQAARRQFIREYALREARYNLDLIAVWKLQGTSQRAEERLKVLRCLRNLTSELLRTAAIRPDEIFKGDGDRSNRDITEAVNTEQLCEAKLFEFSARKIDVIKELAGQDFAIDSLLKSEIRMDNIAKHLRELISKLQDS